MMLIYRVSRNWQGSVCYPFIFTQSFPWFSWSRFYSWSTKPHYDAAVFPPVPIYPSPWFFPRDSNRLHWIYVYRTTFHYILQTALVLSLLVGSSKTFSIQRYTSTYQRPRGTTHCLPKLFVIWHLSCNLRSFTADIYLFLTQPINNINT